MANITYNMNSADLDRIAENFAYAHPIPTDGDGHPVFTPVEWLRERTRRFIVAGEALGRQKREKDAAVYEENDSLVT